MNNTQITVSSPASEITVEGNEVTITASAPSAVTVSVSQVGPQGPPGASAGVSSVFGRSGAVIAESGDYASYYDAAGSAATAQSNAETFAANASNISSGTIGAAYLPTPTLTTIGGVKAIGAVAHQFLTALSATGVLSMAQPAFTDISGSLATAQLPTLASAQIWVGNGSNAATAITLSGDGTLSNAGALTITKSNGVAFGTAAFVNTSAFDAAGAAATAQSNAEAFAANASNLSSGTVASGRLSGSYTGITGVGILTAGTWNATTIAVAHGGTGLTALPGSSGDLLYNQGGAFAATNITYGLDGSSNPMLTPGHIILGVMGTLNASGVFAGLSFEDRSTVGIPNNFTLYANTQVVSIFSNEMGFDVWKVDNTGNETVVNNSQIQNVLDVGINLGFSLGWTGTAQTSIGNNGIAIQATDNIGNSLQLCDGTEALLCQSSFGMTTTLASSYGGTVGEGFAAIFTDKSGNNNLGDFVTLCDNNYAVQIVGFSKIQHDDNNGIDSLNISLTSADSGNNYTNITLNNTNGTICNWVALGDGYDEPAVFGANDCVFLVGQGYSSSRLLFLANSNGSVIFGAGGYSSSDIALTINNDQSSVFSGAVTISPSAHQLFKASGAQVALSTYANSTAAGARLLFTGSADTTLTTTVEAPDIYFNMGQTRQHATGTIALQRDFRVTGSTHSFVGASTITEAATLAIDGAPSGGTNATLTSTEGLLISAGAVTHATTAYGATINAPSGGTNNYTARFVGGRTNFAASASGYSSINIASGSTPSAPATGDLWFDGTHLQFRNGSTTYQIDQQTASSMAFSGLTSATNTAAAMLVGSGASLNFTGTGTINASTLGGATFAAPGAIGGTTPASGAFTSVNATGNISTTVAGSGLVIKSGSNARIGTATLSGGTVTVSNTSVTANTRVFLQDTSGSTTNVGSLTVTTSPGSGFTVTSTLALDTSTFNWHLVESS